MVMESEFKGSIQHVTKGHSTLVTQVDLIKLRKVFVKTSLNSQSTLHIPPWDITLFTVSYFFSEILRIPDNGRNRNLEVFYSFFYETHRDTTTEL